MDTDVVREAWIVNELDTTHGKGKISKFIVDLLPAGRRNSVLDSVWNDVSSIGVSNAPFLSPGDQSSAFWSSLASVLVDIKLVSIVTALNKGIDLPWGNDEITVLAGVTVSVSWSIRCSCRRPAGGTLVRIPLFSSRNLNIFSRQGLFF